jgi:hypothetical protein
MRRGKKKRSQWAKQEAVKESKARGSETVLGCFGYYAECF